MTIENKNNRIVTVFGKTGLFVHLKYPKMSVLNIQLANGGSYAYQIFTHFTTNLLLSRSSTEEVVHS